MDLTFFIKMRDMMSGGLVNIAKTAQSTFGKVQDQVRRVTGRNRILSASFDEITQRMRQTEQVISRSRIPAEIRAARRELERLQQLSNQHSGNVRPSSSGGFGLGSMLRTALPMALMAGALSFGGGTLTDGLMAQARSTSFEVMAGKEAGGALNKDLTKYAADSIYGNEVFKDAQMMMGYGASANEVMPDLKMLGDVAMGSSEKLGALSYAFSNTRAAGKLMGQDLIQYTNAGFNPLQAISEKTGIKIGVLKEKMSEGLISFEMVREAFKTATSEGGRFYNMTERIAQTDYGKVQAFKGQLEGLSTQIGTMLAPVIGDLITNYISPFVTWLGVAANWIKENWDWLGLLITILGTMVIAYQSIIWATNLWTAAQAALNFVMMLNPIILVIALIAGLVAGVIYAWNKFEGFRMAIWGLWGAVKQVFRNIGGFFKFIWQPIFDAIEAFKDGRWADAGKAVLKIGAAIATGGASAAADYALQGGFTKGVSEAYAAESVKGKNKKDAAKSATAGGLSTPGSASVGGAFDSLKSGGGGEDAVKGVTSGGPRVINIHINKMVEKIEVHAASFEKGIDSVQDQVEEVLLRILNSGAALQ